MAQFIPLKDVINLLMPAQTLQVVDTTGHILYKGVAGKFDINTRGLRVIGIDAIKHNVVSLTISSEVTVSVEE